MTAADIIGFILIVAGAIIAFSRKQVLVGAIVAIVGVLVVVGGIHFSARI